MSRQVRSVLGIVVVWLSLLRVIGRGWTVLRLLRIDGFLVPSRVDRDLLVIRLLELLRLLGLLVAGVN